MINLRVRLGKVHSVVTVLYYKAKYPNAKFGNNLVLYGFPIFEFHKRAKIIMGDNVVFNSIHKYNMVGLFKRSTIFVADEAELQIGEHSGFSGVSIYCSTRIIIGRYINCGGNVLIWDTDFHPINYLDRRKHIVEKISKAPVKIGDDAFIGANSIILKGVEIGERSIIAAGSVVTKRVPPDEVWGGNPARFIRRILQKENENIRDN